MSGPYRYIQLDYLEKMAGGDPDTRRELMFLLADELKMSSLQLNVLQRQNEPAQLKRLCHHLRTTIPFVGNSRLASLNHEMEQLLQHGNSINRLPPLLAEMKALLSKSLEELRRELEKG